jgi:cobalamin biosynthesis Mg chelatase CobN
MQYRISFGRSSNYGILYFFDVSFYLGRLALTIERVGGTEAEMFMGYKI